MIETQDKPKRISVGIKIELTKANSDLIKSLHEQASPHIAPTQLTYTNVCNWLIGQHGSTLTTEEIESVRKEFHSERTFAKWIYEEITRRELAGEPVPTIEELIKNKPAAKNVKTRTRKPRKSKKVSESENDEQKGLIDSQSFGGQVPSRLIENDTSRSGL